MRALLAVVAVVSSLLAPLSRAELTGVTAVLAAPNYRSCAVIAGGVKCWGLNGGEYGRYLGDGTTAYRQTHAVDVVGVSDAVSLAGSFFRTCAVTTSGGLRCWPGDTSTYFAGISSGITSFDMSHEHFCAVINGGLKCWGSNTYGQLGDGTNTYRANPTDVPGLTSGVAAVNVGEYHSCALMAGGGVKCWGRNDRGQLGDGSTTNRSTPVDVVGLSSGVVAISAAAAGWGSTCAATSTGTVKCWGLNDRGQLGDDTTTDRSAPVDVVGLSSGATAVSVGTAHACALVAGAVRCWGLNTSGQLGDGSMVDRRTPVPVGGLASDVVAVSAGANHTCAATSDGRALCWGDNWNGQIGNRALIEDTHVRPSSVVGLAGPVAKLTAGGEHNCVILQGGGMQCWGSNSYGQLGQGGSELYSLSDPSRNRATQVVEAGAQTATDVSAGIDHTCAVMAGGDINCWGYNNYGQALDQSIAGGFAAVDAGYQSNVALANDGTAWRWSDSGRTQVASSAAAVAVGARGHVCVLSPAGGVSCSGRDITGATSGITAIAVGGYWGCALTAAGGVKCWGLSSTSPTATDVATLSTGVVGISAGGGHTCAVMSSGLVRCWGYNDLGQVDPSSAIPFFDTPVGVSGLGGSAIAVAAGGRNIFRGSVFGNDLITGHTCALMEDRSVKCWGGNGSGQAGDGRRAPQLTPAAATGVESNLSASIPIAPASASTGKDAIYGVRVTNNGPDHVGRATLTIAIPPGAALIWTTPGCSTAGSSLTCNFDQIPVGGGNGVQLVLRPSSPGTMTLNATVTMADTDPVSSDNTASHQVLVESSTPSVPVPRYRLYSDVTKEHHFTTDLNEYNTLGTYAGTWQQEGTVGKVLDNPGAYNGVEAVPYYRLYDNNTRWHHWTTDPNEYYTLRQFVWWSAEGVDGYILPTQAPGSIPLYRLLYPFVAGLHHWTIDAYEYSVLTSQYGWIGEGGSGFVIP